jgi:hypothetical protein
MISMERVADRTGERPLSAEINERLAERTVLFVAPEFPPCNLTAGHRTRLFVRHLPEFGYKPIVVTVRPSDYETRLDPDLERLVDPRVEVIRTAALPTRPIRMVGDLGIRSFPFHLMAIRKLVRTRRIDLIYLPIPPNYSSLLGPVSRRLFGVPYVIDYIDPWVTPMLSQERKSLKARTSHFLAGWLEPVAVRNVSGITGVAERYYGDVVRRHPRLKSVPLAGIPYGGEPLDHVLAAEQRGLCPLLDRPELRNRIVLAYAGALLPRAHDTLRALLRSCRDWVGSGDPVAARVRLLFVGTGARHNDPSSGLVAPIARECGAQEFVVEIADRQPYVDVLQMLHQVQAVMIVGSDEPHYTASKSFQALMSGRPILAILHKDSTASEFLARQPGVSLVTFSNIEPLDKQVAAICSALASVTQPDAGPVMRNGPDLEALTAREAARKLARFFDTVLSRNGAASGQQ